ncbi:uncharacterized protein [Littorina saxatilis]|uniref:Uncharacterized protein n=1 Tax=Littorina saxatilis TaxID=31220 RepID=A0AAN9BM67_9CAEN
MSSYTEKNVVLAPKVIFLVIAIICAAHGSTQFSHESAVAKSASYARSEKSGHASQKTHTRVSGHRENPPLPLDQRPPPEATEVENGGSEMNLAQPGSAHSRSGSSSSSHGQTGSWVHQSQRSSSSAAHSSSRHESESRSNMSSSEASHSSAEAAARSHRSQAGRKVMDNEASRRHTAARDSGSKGKPQSDGPMTSESRASMSDLDKVSAMAADTEQRAYFRELFSRRCKDCAVSGQTFRGHSRFEYTEGCNRYRCICSCDGSYNCPPRYTMDVCKAGEEGGSRATAQRTSPRRRRCERCQAFGQEFEGNAYFDAQDGCTKYRGCVCYCNGTWNCPSERAVDTCQPKTTTAAPAPSCRACNAKGKVVEGNSYFELEEPCKRYRYCRCLCDGSWTCPDQFVEDTCRSSAPEDEEIPGCKKCDAKGKEIMSNTYFEMTDGCVEFKNCVCRCNGSWSCPSQYAKNICNDQESGRGQAGRDTDVASSSIAECQSCFAHGSYFRGNTRFTTRSGCTLYDRCVCRCDSSWDCPARFATNVCEDDDPSNDVTTDTCSYCDADGRIIPSNSYFNMTEGCVQYDRCLCHCDGQWVCPERFSRNTCESEARREEPSAARVCNSCQVDSRVVRGNSYFEHVTGCYRYRDCLCKCDGNYECQEDRAENICAYNRTAAAAVASSSSSSSSSSQSSSAQSSSAQASSASSGASSTASRTSSSSSSSSPSACLRCFAYGQFYSPNTAFVRQEGCFEYTCDCHCNGSFTCPEERKRNTCGTGCRECELDGQFFEGNTYFKHRQGCIEYMCTCYCNGSYECPADRANNTCGTTDRANAAGRSTVTDVGNLGRNGCIRCVTKDGDSHSPDSDFTLSEGCIHYQCRCNCDGSWNCPGEAARNVCRQEVLGGCRSCVISETQIFRGDEDFQMREGCIHYMCRCNCDGSWNCPKEKARDVCLGEVPGGCRVCRVSENETYRGDTQFPLRQGCNHYTCNCHCNGSWECPGETSRDVCIGEVPGGCRVCKMDDGTNHRGESDFQLEKDCVRYQCRCNCNGSWSCPGEGAQRICNADGSPLTQYQPDQRASTQRPPPQRQPSSCRRCAVSDAEQFAPNQPFTLRRGCNEYQCRCECDGSWNCPGDRARNICGRRDDPRLRAETCQSCQVSTYSYPGRSTFLLTRGCAQYTCQCDCSGRWSCDHTNARNVCEDSDGSSSSGVTSGSSSGSRRTSARTFSSASSSAEITASQQQQQQQTRRRTSASATRGSSVSAANLGSYVAATRPAGPCTQCRVDGRDYSPDSDFVIEKKCKRFNCFCACNGRWRCPRDRTEELCRDDTAAAAASSASSRQRGAERRRTSTVYTQTGTEGQRSGRTMVRVIGADTAAASSQAQGSQAAGGVNVHGYYVAPRQQPHGFTDTRTRGTQAFGNNQRTAFVQRAQQAAYGQTSYQQGNGQSQQAYNLRQQLHQYSQGQSQNGNQGAFSAAAVASSNQDSRSAVVVVDGADNSSAQTGSTCTDCVVDEKTYRAGAKFNWRRGCIIYKCSCLCSGSYRCGLSIDPNCSEEDAKAGAGGIPTGPLASGSSAGQPGGSCGNCYVSGYVYPGNMSFSLRQGCNELSCRCGCDGHHQCSEPKPITGCTAMSTPLAGAVYPYGASPAVYPVGGGGYAVRPGRIVSSYQQTYYNAGGADCPTCVPAAGAGGGGGRGVLIPAMMAGTNRFTLHTQPQAPNAQPYYNNGQQPPKPEAPHSPQSPMMQGGQSVPQAQPAGTRGRTNVQMVAMQPVDVPDEVLADSMVDKTCATCFVNGMSHRGSFEFTKDCYQVTCYCDCSGWLRCSVQPAMTAECPAQYGPVSGQCRSCVVQSHEYPPNLHFALRVGCYGYDCSCGCDGLWMCPTQQPSNYCVRPATPLAGVGDDRYDVMAAERGGAGHSVPAEMKGSSHSGHTGGLKDSTFSRSADDSVLACRDCEVRGTTYPSRTRFFLRDGCQQNTCDCACDGSWSCPKNETVDVCREDRQSRENNDNANKDQQERDRRVQEERDRRLGLEREQLKRVLEEKERALAQKAAQQARLATAANDAECRSCQVDGKHYITEQDFQYRRGCHLFTCHCFCNGSFECPASKTRDMCRSTEYRRDGCRQCHIGNKTYPGSSAFAYREGCWEFNCQCGCNGQPDCPPARSRDLCNAGGSPPVVAGGAGGVASLREHGAQGDPQPASRCKPCLVDGQVIRSRTAFNEKRGCKEYLCHCACNGTWSCPPDRSVDVCDMDNLKEQSQQGGDAKQRKGCTVGRRTYFTHLFAYTEGCIQHMCVCYDDGTWLCPPGKELYIC